MATYAINITNVEYINLTKNAIEEDENLLQEVAENYNIGSIEEFKYSSEFYEYTSKYDPAWIYGYIVGKTTVSDELIELLLIVCSDILVLHSESLETYMLGLSASGSDYSDQIELALLLIDCESYIFVDEILNLSEKGEKLLIYLRGLTKSQRMELDVEDIYKKLKEGN